MPKQPAGSRSYPVFARGTSLLLGLVALVALACGPPAVTASEPTAARSIDGERDDVLVVLLDDIGKDALAVYGAESAARTPVLDRLAREGIVYDRAYASPLCSPSRALLVTGRYGFRTGFGRNSRDGSSPFGDDLAGPSVPECLRAALPDERPFIAWYGKWHLVASGSPDADRHPIAVGGFERFVGHLGNLGSEEGPLDTHHYRWRKVDADLEASREEIVDGEELGYDERSWASAVCRRALSADLAALDPMRRAVIFFAPVAPHAPLQSPPSSLVSAATAASVPAPQAIERTGRKQHRKRALQRALYLAQIEAIDTSIGELLDALPAQRRERTTIVVFGDNGTPPDLLGAPHDSLHGKGQVYEQGVAVPLIVVGPRVAAPGTRCAALVHLVDVPATIAELVSEHSIGGDGRSFASTFADPSAPGPRTSLLTEVFSPNGRGRSPAWTRRAMIERRYKLVRSSSALGVREELYDIEADPLETTDLLRGEGELADDAQAALERLRAELDTLLAG